MAAEASDRFSGDVMVAGEDLPPIFGIKLGGKFRRPHEVTEQDSQVAPFGA